MTRRGEFDLDSEYPRGVDDPALSADCRGRYGSGGFVRPRVALSSPANWGDDVLTPQGLCDGDEPSCYARSPIEEIAGDPIKVEHFDSDFACYCDYCLQRVVVLGEASVEYIERAFSEVLDDAEEPDKVCTPEAVAESSSFEDSYSLGYEYLPKRTSSGVIREARDSQMEIRQGGRKYGRATFSHGKRGNNYYKLLRRGRVRAKRVIQ